MTIYFDAPIVLGKDTWPPNYTDVFGFRLQQLLRFRKDPDFVLGAKEYYRTRPVEFITHWIDTHDPRTSYAGDLPKDLPFVLFERQAQLVRFLQGCLTDQQNGVVDKSRDTGVTWVASAFSIWLWLFVPGSDTGWGSRKSDLVDKLDDPKSIFAKMRKAIRRLPPMLLPEGFDGSKHLSYLRFFNPENESTITGEGGDSIGRGGRTLIYFLDEAAHVEHPESVAAALMDNTNVEIDISTHNGIGTVFDQKRNGGREWEPGSPPPPRGTTRVFVFDWSDHPAKTQAWHDEREKSARDAGMLHLFRQEVDRDPAASLVGVIIPAEWARAAVDAHIKLKLPESGGECAGFDPADEGGDLHAYARRKGIILRECVDWGAGDTGEATREIIRMMAGHSPIAVQYDCIGIGAGVKSEANRLSKIGQLPSGINFCAWDAGASVLMPEARVIPGDSSMPTNEDFYGNLKSQSAWNLRLRFERTYRMLTEKDVTFPTDQLISLDSRIPNLHSLLRELSQPIIKKSGDLKLLVDKKPEGAKSPNKFDAVSMCYFPVKLPMVISDAAMKRFGAGLRHR
jgi:phage terminase large subunit